ncbi:unnamed protein product [Rhizoctonia solani]|uniref:Uncharacterized protein n=1 Tax=Rhizoctonia solani TaxID=456999 RepID=A0A8H3BFQ6_9AGAM|nr:unnamed protein product [Rhizoctonia solani]
MTVDSTTTTSVCFTSSGSTLHETVLPLSPPISPEDQASFPRQRNKIIHQIQHRASPTGSTSSTTTTAVSETLAALNQAIHRASTPETVCVKAEIASPAASLGPEDPDVTVRPDGQQLEEDQKPNPTHETSSPTARALRSLGLTREDLAQHAQRMKSFLGAGGRRGFPSAAELASTQVKPEPTDSDMLLTQSSTSSAHRQASVVSFTSSACTTTTTDISRASSTYPNGPSTSTSFDTTPSRHRRTARGRPVLPPLPPSSPPPMLSPVRSGESNRTGINSSPIRSPLASPPRAGPSRNYPTDYANPNDPPYTLPPAPRPREKPAASYAALIGQAIMSAISGPDGKKKLTLAQIYAWISAAWPFYKPGEAGWMNSIRHNLSLNDCFVKIKRDGREKGKGSFWGIREGDEDMFANGGFVRRNSAAKKRKKEPTPGREEPETRPAHVEPIKRARTNTAPAASTYVYDPPQYPPLPSTSRGAIPKTTATSQPPKRARAPTATTANKKTYRSPVGDRAPSSSPARAESGKRAQRQEPPPELTPNMSSSPDAPASSPISSSPPPQSNDGGSAERPAGPEYSTKSGLMDMIMNNSAKKRKVSGSGINPNRLGAFGNGSPVMKRRPNGAEEEPRTIYPASMLNRPGSPTQHINPRATLKTRNEHARRESPPVVRPDDLKVSSRGSEPVTPPRTLEKPNPFNDSGSGGLDRPQFVALKPSDIIPTTPPRTLAPLTVATSAERTPLSHAALHMSPSRPSDLSHFKTSLHPPPNDWTTPLMMRRVPSLNGIMLAMPTESPLRTPLGYGGARDINDLNSGCAEELMMTPASRLAIAGTAPGNEQSPSMLFGGIWSSASSSMSLERDDDEWAETKVARRKSKRVKREYTYSTSPLVSEPPEDPDLQHASSFLQSVQRLAIPDTEFESVSDLIIPELVDARRRVEAASVVRNEHGHVVRSLSRIEGDQLVDEIIQKQQVGAATASENILLRRLSQRGSLAPGPSLPKVQEPAVVEALDGLVDPPPPPQDVLDKLYAIKTTPLECSFASRLYGGQFSSPMVFYQDWESMSPWMELMADIMDHYRLSRPKDTDVNPYSWAPITYTPIYAWHLPQVHDLLERAFWPGIDVSDSVKWEPEQCSVVALYKKLVVGCAFLSEPMDPYVTYITVRAGWEQSGIATFMLYHLIKTNPNNDISLHVSATNPAMLLYNRFGFKAEEFVVGFYDDYLDGQSKLCKNALRMRYRR